MRKDFANGFSSMPSATGGIARLACAGLRKSGKDVRHVLSAAGLSVQELNDSAARLAVRTQLKVLELAAEELRDDFFGFHLARSFDLREIGLVYYVMASSEYLAEALRNCVRYSKINNEGVRLRFSLDRAATIALEYVDVDRRSDRHHLEFWLVTLVRICRQLTDSRLAPLKLKVRHVRARRPAEFKTFFGTEVEFGADAARSFFQRQSLRFQLWDATLISTSYCDDTPKRPLARGRKTTRPSDPRCSASRRSYFHTAKPMHRRSRASLG